MLIALLLLAVQMIAQEQEQTKPPKPPGRGDLVEARGCVKAGVLESSELSKQGSEDRYTEFTVFRLTGDKKVLESIRKEHDGHADVITGELRSDLPKSSQTPGKTVGNTRITIGVRPASGMEPPPPMPVLKATGIEHTGVTCRSGYPVR
jgi:hypothetical protein